MVLIARHGIQKNDAPALLFVAVFPGRIEDVCTKANLILLIKARHRQDL